METAIVISNALLWVIVVALAVICLALTRQIGILDERLTPVGALMIDKGPAVGALAPVFEVSDVADRPVKVGGVHADGSSTLLFFVSPTCPVCKKLLPLMPDIATSEANWLRIVLVSDGGDAADHAALIRRMHLESLPYVLSQEVGMAFAIGKLPYGVLLDDKGSVSAKGLVNSREHLESLFEAKERQVASLQEYVHGKPSLAPAAAVEQ
ncbi:MAG: methylamine dehydrogenase accessory protein MauD [Burkholderiaceae bacterium]|jgi:methylamine dehydrogenase accessory protein MauD|nr:methylamine dehydrogenase accessory protein MauD [Burkholderiaceae bacterium]